MKKIILTALATAGLAFFSFAQAKHVVGEKWGGGVVFIVDPDGRHGLIAETLNQGNTSWAHAKEICKTGTHSKAGKAFKDWRLPTKAELNEMYVHIFDIDGFTSGNYWSSTEEGTGYAWGEDFVDGTQTPDFKTWPNDVRAVRAF